MTTATGLPRNGLSVKTSTCLKGSVLMAATRHPVAGLSIHSKTENRCLTPIFASVLQDPQQVVVRVGEGRQLAPVGDRLGGVVDRRPVEELLVAGDDDLVGR